MYNLLAFLALAILTAATPATHLQPRQSPSTLSMLPFNLTYAFTAHLMLGKANRPIPIPGGFLLTEPIANGTVTGPYINATVSGGIAAPAVYENQTLQIPRIYLYGSTSDGRSFFVEEAGIGKPAGQVTRITLTVNGTGNAGYQKLVDGFILASVNPNANATQVSVQAYLVDDITTFSY